MSHLFPTYAKWDVTITSGKGTKLYDNQGNEYLDFVSGIAVCNLGHCHPKVVAAVEEQLHSFWHVSNLFHIPIQENVAALLTEQSGMDAVFFCNSGAEANEAAIKLARKATGKHEIVTFTQSFHGRTLGTMSATGQDKIKTGFGPMLETFHHVPFNDIAALKQVVNEQTAAIVLEVIQGEGGVNLIDPEFAASVNHVCQEHGILLIVDEIQTGIGRTGTAFAFQQYELTPDIITVAKGLGNGFPVGAMLGKQHLIDAFSAGSHGSTFGGNPLAMAAAQAVLTEVFQPNFLQAVQEKGKQLLSGLNEALSGLEIVKEIRGNGLLVGIELQEEGAPFIKQLREKGLLVLNAGPNVIRLLPPLVVTSEELHEAVTQLKEVLDQASVHA
ncbi:acetylornithine transaminase [Halalkalibacterium halodurans]|uniref:Acetylornithine aminotransferase n=1 Tax=Halalkalibacterium halodurans TaxID=86665 RepID=A0A0M0KI91_ALKHA|nr:acetylornithine transaminase [Halalkalibacterium halodurans]MED4164204.1 acetylornithine transaminase [Halalkalibacterium halodurans]TPE69706.1 acetylornithine transaminase [Halalkalibacterium halodurans]